MLTCLVHHAASKQLHLCNPRQGSWTNLSRLHRRSLHYLAQSTFVSGAAEQVMDEAAFQAEVFKLRSREWPYYLAANRDSLQAVPDLSDLSGGLSNPTQFNFLMYILWKVRWGRCNCSWGCNAAFVFPCACKAVWSRLLSVVAVPWWFWSRRLLRSGQTMHCHSCTRVAPQVAARHAADPATRSALTKEAGLRLAQRVAGDAIALARSSGHGDGISDGTKAAVTSALQVLVVRPVPHQQPALAAFGDCAAATSWFI